MTFTEIKTEIMDRVGYTYTTDDTRVGRAINRHYREITASLGIRHTSRRSTASAACTPGVSTLQFTSAEKVIAVYNRNSTPYVQLEEVTVDELRAQQPFNASDTPSQYALLTLASDSVTILLNCVPQTGITLYADVYATTATLSGSDEPAFPESYHDVLISAVLIDEYLKLEKPSLSAAMEKRVKERLGELRHWIAVSTTKKQYQGKTSETALGRLTGSGGSGTAFDGSQSWTQTGLITFDRSAGGDVAPFAVDSDADAVVTNLDADKVDGYHAAALAALAEDEVITGTYTVRATADRANLLKFELGTVGTPVTGSANRIWLRYDGYDTVNTADPTLWSYGALFQHFQSGGNGHRAALVAQMNVSGSPTRSSTTNSVALTALMFGASNDGNYFGTNPYVRVSAGTGASAIGEEINTDCQVAVVDKVGLQIVDVTASVGAPSGRNYALRFVNQTSAYGFAYGIVFDNSPAASVRSSGTLIYVVGGSYGRGLDLSAGSFSGEGIYLPRGVYVAGKNAGGTAASLIGYSGSGSKIDLGNASDPIDVLGGQVKFPGTQLASSDANTLDDYEEGSWTPVIGGTGGTSGQAYSYQTGRYIKIGRIVVCSFDVLLSTEGTITANVQISGLPFTSANVSNLVSSSPIRYGSLATNWVNVQAVIAPNTSVALVRGATAAAASNDTSLTAADINNTTFFSGTFTYLADA